jgi:hypothetical protein
MGMCLSGNKNTRRGFSKFCMIGFLDLLWRIRKRPKSTQQLKTLKKHFTQNYDLCVWGRRSNNLTDLNVFGTDFNREVGPAQISEIWPPGGLPPWKKQTSGNVNPPEKLSTVQTITKHTK